MIKERTRDLFVIHHCEDINYQYQNGLNSLYLNFPVH
jgi:hypothetical protein